MFVGTLSFEETGGLPERSDGETRAGGVGPPRSVWQPPGQAPPNVSRRGLYLGVTLLRGGWTPPAIEAGPKGPHGTRLDSGTLRKEFARRLQGSTGFSAPGSAVFGLEFGLLLGGAPRQGPQGLWRQRARRPAVGLASTAGRWLASPTVSRWASHHPGPRPSCGFRAWGLGPAPCQSGTGTRFMNRLPARGGGLPLAGRFHERKASRHHSGVVGPGLMTVQARPGPVP